MSNALARFSSFHLYIYYRIDIANTLPTSALLSGLVQRMFSSRGIRNAAIPQQSFPHPIPMTICKGGMPSPPDLPPFGMLGVFGGLRIYSKPHYSFPPYSLMFLPHYSLGVITHYDVSLAILHERPFALEEAPQSHSQSTGREGILDQLRKPTSHQCCGWHSSTYGHCSVCSLKVVYLQKSYQS